MFGKTERNIYLKEGLEILKRMALKFSLRKLRFILRTGLILK